MENRIKAVNVLKSAVLFYKKHFLLLISLSASQYFVKYLKILSSQSYNRSALLEIVFFVFDLWISIGFIMVISRLYKNRPFDFNEIFAWVRKKFWPFFGITLLVGFIGILAAIPNIIVLFKVDNFVLKLILTILFAPLPIYFYTIFNFAPIITALREYDEDVEEFGGSLDASTRLVKQNFWLVVILVSISYLIDLPDMIKAINAIKFKDIATMENLISFKFIFKNILFAPLIYTIDVMLYYLLSNKNNDHLIEE
ncbi:hypothetical protein R9X47_26640 [Wukongibacter baidiensis]|uniref:hypothetical protein n=1 Tax=Wukongibacter baidiensis TaxID=1723361 RepID=UPI003D7F4D71